MASTLILVFFSLMLFTASLCLGGGCIESERVALLQFKNGLSDPSNRLSDWVLDGSECCKWTGVVCHNVTFHVLELHLRTLSYEEYFGLDPYLLTHYDNSEYEEYLTKSVFGGKVSDSLLDLKHISYLDLSNNDFGGVALPKFIGSLQSLRYLNLSKAGFGGIIPPQLGNLSNLHYLNLGNLFMHVENLDWVSRLSRLEFLDMSYVDLSQSYDWFNVMNSLPSLLELHLSYCTLPNLLPSLNSSSSLLVLDLSFNYFGGPIPNGLRNMTSSFLRELDLSRNNFNSSIPNWLYDLTHLELLNLRHNQLQGQISSEGIENLTSLVTLDMSFNLLLEYEKGITNSFRKICSLKELGLSGVKLNQEINDVFAIMSECASNVLQSLDLSGCQLSGHLTGNLAYFKNLKTFIISNNSISGPIPLSIGEINSLVVLRLDFNRLNGSLPVSFGNLKELEEVDISDNKLDGQVSHLLFANLTRLSYFAASRNNIAFRVSPDWIPPLQLQILALQSWHIGSRFPNWLHLLKHLLYLDLSNSGISTQAPVWFWHSFSNCQFLNFSHNQIHGSIPDIPFSMFLIDLSHNNFSGMIPYISPNVSALDLSNNSFSGSIRDFLCYNMDAEKELEVLNLENNLLHGEIPDCWSSWQQLAAVKLSNNKFGGHIPNSIGTLSSLELLHIRNNNLSGEIPSSFQDCKKLVILDFSRNNLVGNIPPWIGDGFVDLRILSLQANKFKGYLPKELCGLVSLHILDLAHNSFSGTIPSCFSNFTGMAIRNDSSGALYANTTWASMDTGLLVMKGKMMEYSTNLGFVRSIDLSDNNLSGEIPTEITSIVGLLSLNLSQNALTGTIPNSIGDMKGLEAIDLSHNKLSGEIPQSMSTLTFLSTLDLSYNNLSGRIPSGTQLQSFDSSSFIGNQLCGLPLTNNCTLDTPPLETKEEDENEDEDEVDVWFYGSIAFGFVFGFWSVVGSLVFIRRWRYFYFRSVYYFGEKIWWNFIRRLH